MSLVHNFTVLTAPVQKIDDIITWDLRCKAQESKWKVIMKNVVVI